MSDLEKIKETALTLAQQAASFSIVDQGTFEEASQYRSGLKELHKKAEEEYGKPVAAAWESHKAALALKKSVTAPIVAAMKLVDGKLLDYKREQDRVAREAERKAAQELERLERERELELARLQQKEEDRVLDLAAKAEEEGNREVAEELLSAPVVVHAPPMPIVPAAAPQPPKADGISFAGRWKGEVTNLKALVAYIAGGHWEYLGLLNVSAGAISRLATSQQDNCSIPGLRIYRESHVRTK